MKLLLPVALLVLVLVPVQWMNVCVSGSDSDSIQCREEERLALLHINSAWPNSIHSSVEKECYQWKDKWEGKECCRWERVTCDPITGHVTQLDLSLKFDQVKDWPDCWVISLNASMLLPLRQLRSLSLSALGISHFMDGTGRKTWSSLTKLEILDLSNNFLDRSIVYDLASVPSLRTLDLSGNNINSNLPINGFESWSNLTKLEILDLSYNDLDGSIIYDLASVSSLRTLDLSFNYINSIKLPINGFEYWSNLTKLEILDLSVNLLPRSIISSLAKVTSLQALYLDFNYPMGDNVPVKELSALNLEVVSLNECGFKGSFPYVGHWSSLRSLSLAYNSLSGALTSTDGVNDYGSEVGELNFSDANFLLHIAYDVDMNSDESTNFGMELMSKGSYEGNPNLCGPPLSNSCGPTLGTTQPSPNEMSDAKRCDGTDFFILFGSFSLFFVVSFWGSIAILYFKRNWRYALFTLVDWYGDMIYVKIILLARKIGVARTRMGN